MNPRHISILDAVISMYVKDAEPVSSTEVANYLDNSLSPASIRNILSQLEEMGYLEQPHTSSGRIPTDLGYRFYVNRLKTRNLPQQEQQKIVSEYNTGTKQGAARSRQLARILASRSHALAISSWLNDHEIHEAGLGEVVDEHDVVREISNFLDQLDTSLEKISDSSKNDTTVFIGRENPFFNTQHTSLMVRTIKTPKGDIVLLLIGPKRMRYDQNVSLLNGVAQIANSL